MVCSRLSRRRFALYIKMSMDYEIYILIIAIGTNFEILWFAYVWPQISTTQRQRDAEKVFSIYGIRRHGRDNVEALRVLYGGRATTGSSDIYSREEYSTRREWPLDGLDLYYWIYWLYFYLFVFIVSCGPSGSSGRLISFPFVVFSIISQSTSYVIAWQSEHDVAGMAPTIPNTILFL
jgi:hypothetical protein